MARLVVSAATEPPVTPLAQPDFDPVHRFSSWLARMGKAEATVNAYHADVGDLVRAFAPRPAAELLSRDVREYLAARAAEEQWSRSTVRRHLQAIKAYYRYLVSEEGVRAPGPAEALAGPVPAPREPYVLSEADVGSLFAYLESRADARPGSVERMDLALYGLCYHAALLVSEAVGLAREAVRGGPAVMRLAVVGRRGSESEVRLSGDAARWLGAWLAERPRPKRRSHDAFVFIHPRTRVHTSRQRAWDRLRRVARAAGLEAETVARIGPHTLRHSYAAHLASRALGVADLREALRQRSPGYARQYVRTSSRGGVVA